MRKLFFGLILVGMTAMSSYAADVAERTDCGALKNRIAEMSARDDLSDDETETLAELRATQRRDCTARAGARAARTVAGTKTRAPVVVDTPVAAVDTPAPVAVPAPVVDDASDAVAASCDTPDANGCCDGEEFEDFGDAGKMCCRGDMCYPPMKTAAEIQAEQDAEIAENLAKGLCGDGTRANKFGCCGDEKFKEISTGSFGCCLGDGADQICHEPINDGYALIP